MDQDKAKVMHMWKNTRQLPFRLLLATLSGVSVWPVYYLLDSLMGTEVGDLTDPIWDLIIGGIFGLLVLVPFVTEIRFRYFRILGLVAGSISIYALAVELAIAGYGFFDLPSNASIIVSGWLGANLVGVLAQQLTPISATWQLWIYLSLAGLIGGFIFSLTYLSSLMSTIALGYIAWQVPVCLALLSGIKIDIQHGL